MSHLIKKLCTLTGTKKSRTTPYHSMGNGMTEKFKRTLLEMLGTLEPEKKEKLESTRRTFSSCIQLYTPQLNKPITIFSNFWKTTKITPRFSFRINYRRRTKTTHKIHSGKGSYKHTN